MTWHLCARRRRRNVHWRYLDSLDSCSRGIFPLADSTQCLRSCAPFQRCPVDTSTAAASLTHGISTVVGIVDFLGSSLHFSNQPHTRLCAAWVEQGDCEPSTTRDHRRRLNPSTGQPASTVALRPWQGYSVHDTCRYRNHWQHRQQQQQRSSRLAAAVAHGGAGTAQSG